MIIDWIIATAATLYLLPYIVAGILFLVAGICYVIAKLL